MQPLPMYTALDRALAQPFANQNWAWKCLVLQSAERRPAARSSLISAADFRRARSTGLTPAWYDCAQLMCASIGRRLRLLGDKTICSSRRLPQLHSLRWQFPVLDMQETCGRGRHRSEWSTGLKLGIIRMSRFKPASWTM